MKTAANDAKARSHIGRIKSPKKTISRLMKVIFAKNKLKFFISFVCIIISSYASVYSASFLSEIIDEIGVQLEVSKSGLTVTYNAIINCILKMLVIFAAGILSSMLYVMLMAVMSQSILKNVRNEMFKKMQTLPVKYFDTHSFGNTMSHFTNDTDALEQLISQSIPNILSSLITIIVAMVQMFMLSWQLTIVVILTVFAMMFVVKGVGGKSANFFIRQQRSIAEVNGFIEEMINGQKVIKVFCHENQSKKDFAVVNENLCNDATNANKYANMFMPIMGNLTYIQYALVAVIGGVMAINGSLILNGSQSALGPLAAVAAFLLLSRTFTRPISMVSQQFNSIIMAIAGAERIFEVMDEQPEKDEAYVTLVRADETADGKIVENVDGKIYAWKHPHNDGTLTYTKLRGDVYMEKVDFSYDGVKQVLTDVSIDVVAGKKIALIGKTGAGKTTITNLINRFYDIDDGKIRYDNININKIKKSDLRKTLGVVLQEVHLFTGTVMDNIRYGKLDATDEEVYAAAKLAQADEFIKLLPDGYNTMLTSDGASLSQGQRQLLSIARVAIANPPVMILDEATSSIDTRTEAIVQRGMDNLMQGRTVFVIAHRLSTIRNADNIIVLDNGSIVEQGNHDELMKLKGAYYSLYNGSRSTSIE